MTYYNRENICDQCKVEKLKPGNAYREKNKDGNWTGKWLCGKCRSRYRCYGMYEKPIKKYNLTNTCDRCRELDIETKLYPKNAKRERNKEGKETGRWICNKCYLRNDYIERFKIGHRKTGSLDLNSNCAKGDNSQELACMLYEWEDLNKKYDSYLTPIDCYDPKTGLYHQIKGRCYFSIERCWAFGGLEREWEKIFENMICFCFSKDGKTVERIYVIPIEEIKYNWVRCPPPLVPTSSATQSARFARRQCGGGHPMNPRNICTIKTCIHRP